MTTLCWRAALDCRTGQSKGRYRSRTHAHAFNPSRCHCVSNGPTAKNQYRCRGPNMFLISIMHDNKHQFTHSKLHINFFLSSLSFFFLPILLLLSLLSGIASWFTDLVTKYVTHTWIFWVLQPNFMIHGRIFLWIWVSHLTQIVSPESSWDNNHHSTYFGKTKNFHKMTIG